MNSVLACLAEIWWRGRGDSVSVLTCITQGTTVAEGKTDTDPGLRSELDGMDVARPSQGTWHDLSFLFCRPSGLDCTTSRQTRQKTQVILQLDRDPSTSQHSPVGNTSNHLQHFLRTSISVRICQKICSVNKDILIVVRPIWIIQAAVLRGPHRVLFPLLICNVFPDESG